MAKVAKLVLVSLMTRIIVDEDLIKDKETADEVMLDIARPQFIDKVMNELGENLEEIYDDTEMPYGSSINDK